MCLMRSYVTCHLAEVMFPPLHQPIKTGVRFSNPREMQDWVGIVSWLHIRRWCTCPKMVTHPVLTGLDAWVTLRPAQLLLTRVTIQFMRLYSTGISPANPAASCHLCNRKSVPAKSVFCSWEGYCRSRVTWPCITVSVLYSPAVWMA